MKCPDLRDLPPPPPGRTGWPWESTGNSKPEAYSSLPRISIVTPSLNQGMFLEETIRSVLLQGYPDLEYTVIDGGSDDNSVEIIRKYAPWLHYWVSAPDKGQSDAINTGFKSASGYIFAFINSDDLYEPGALLAIGTEFAKSCETRLLAGDCLIFGDVPERIFSARRPDNPGHMLEPFGSTFPQPSSFWTRAVYEQVGGFDEGLHYIFDREYFLKIGLAGTVPLIMRRILSRHRVHAQTKTARTMRFYEESVPVIERYATKCGLNSLEMESLKTRCRDEIGYLSVFATWKNRGRVAGMSEFCKLVLHSPHLITERKILGQLRRLLFFDELNVAELRNV